MRRGRVVAGLLFMAALIVGCSGQLPRPVPERSPLAMPAHTLYFPVIARGWNKLGLAGCPASCAEFGCAWCYSWSTDPGRLPGVETVPMIWDEARVDWPVGGSSGWVMGFNEPDLHNQAHLTPEQAVEPWAVVEQRFQDRKLLSPAPSSSNPGWLPAFRSEFFARYGRWPRFDGLAMHCYLNSAAKCTGLLNQYEAWANAWGVPEIWVTEFFFAQESEARAFAAELERRSIVTRWAPYVSYKDCSAGGDWAWDCVRGGDPSIMQADRVHLTNMGRWYAPTAQDR